jgi:sugar lactone lactonase YvrE
MSTVFDNRVCGLGEGPLWHPIREQLFWFDIIGKRLLSQNDGKPLEWAFEEHVSAAGWVSRAELLIASETALLLFNLENGTSRPLCALEADKPANRSNDGRADPFGGFWIGTMGKAAEAGAGAIYRFYQGRLITLFENLSIPNAICFSPDASHAYFTDTVTGCIQSVELDAQGWPKAAPEVFLDLKAEGLAPDGAVVDRHGQIWVAQWGAARVACYDASGRFVTAVAMPAPHTTCPAFGGADLRTLFCTSATQGLSEAAIKNAPHSGMVFAAAGTVQGQYEHQVIMDDALRGEAR